MKKLDYVNIKVGTDNHPRFSGGNVLPMTALPHAMAAFVPQTSGARGAFFYSPRDRYIEGVRLTHQPSPWVGDFSWFTFMPQSNAPYIQPDLRWSSFRPEDAVLRPDYQKIRFLRYRAEMELTPTDGGAALLVSYDKNDRPLFAVLPGDFPGEIEIDYKNSLVRGYTTSKTVVPENNDFRIYFLFKFDCPLLPETSTLCDSSGVRQEKNNGAFRAKGAGAVVTLGAHNVCVRLATSYLGYAQAELNMEREQGVKSFEELRRAAEREWENVLNKIEVAAPERTMQMFYSCMYRAFLYPTKLFETDADGRAWHVNPDNNEVKPGVMYTNNGFWDTYRTVYPLYSILCPDKYREIVQGYLNFYDDTGYLPRWPAPSEFGCMPGTLVEAVLADAVVKGILGEKDARRALEACLKNATVQSPDPKRGRKSIAAYRKLGYVPNNLERESVNETLDNCYGDYCIARIADALGESVTAKEYYGYAKNYKNVFDPESGLMRGRDDKGNRAKEFIPHAWGGEYTEGSAWQNSFAVPHDMAGLAELYGGREKLLQKIDEVFDTPPIFDVGGYGFEIHEMSEMAALDFGQCAISNQPSFHIPYIYSELGDRAKTEYWTEKLAAVFSPESGGLPGDEDNGTMACWYIFTCLGFYPFCPGRGDYTVSKPLLDDFTIHLSNGKKLTRKDLENQPRILHNETFGTK